MPNKMAELWKGKAVLVSVYVERPRERRVSSLSSNSHHNHHHHHHHRRHHYVHHIIKQEVTLHKNGNSGKGYSRRAELLHYSQRLRDSATRLVTSSPQPISSNNHNHRPATNIVATAKKPSYSKSRSTSPACLGNWKILIQNFCRSLTSLQAKEKKKKKHTGSTGNVMRAIMKSLEVQKKNGFILKLLSKLQRHR